MKHTGIKQLETERLILRRFTVDDAGAMWDNWASDDEVTKFLGWPTHDNAGVSRKVLEDWEKSYKNDNFYNWAVELKSIGEPIGSMGAISWNEDIKMCEIGYCIGKKWWRNGYTSEALAAVIKFFFKEVGVNRIEARHDPQNPNSGKVMAKCGMKCEGLLKMAQKNNMGIRDCVVYGFIAEEYEGI
jgi:ribosomal-protein-alanine N-acetyltransferase